MPKARTSSSSSTTHQMLLPATRHGRGSARGTGDRGCAAGRTGDSGGDDSLWALIREEIRASLAMLNPTQPPSSTSVVSTTTSVSGAVSSPLTTSPVGAVTRAQVHAVGSQGAG